MKKLIAKRPDIAFYLKLFAIVSRDPQMVKSIVCTKSLPALEDAYEHKAVPKEECQSSEVDDNGKFVEANGITAAPALIFPDGSIQLGYSEAAQLEKRIEESTTKPKALESTKAGGQGQTTK